MIFGLKGTKTIPVGPLGISINVHLNNTILHSKGNLLIGGSRSSMHDEENGLVRFRAELLLGKGLVLAKALWLKRNIARLVHTMDVTKCSSNREHVANLGESLVHRPNLLRGSVELFRINILVADTILLSASDANLHLEPHLHADHALEVLLANSDVLLIRLLRKVKHVGGEERLAILGEILLISLEHLVKPREKLLGTVIRMKDNRDTIVRGNSTNVQGHGNGTSSGSVGILTGLSSVESTSAVGRLNHDRAVVLLRGLKDSIARRRGCAVKRRDGVAIVLGVLKKLEEVVSCNNTGGDVAHD
mmetsp:Transcript_46552/g.141035  ORF Transcript_46552/g.141035 Transcript_46552/m.141035 type:complete len:304 (-) Transcript_46552:152-1063(-)